MYLVIRRRAAPLICLLALVCTGSSLFFGLSVPTIADTSVAEGIYLPILMYHSVLQNPGRQGDYVVSPKVLEQDLTYLAENGYSAISAAQLIAYVYEGAPLPEKPVMITFDDGFRNNLTYAVPLLEKYDMRAIISVVGSYTEHYSSTDDHNPAYAYLSYTDICEASASEYIEIGNHSYDMHNKNNRNGTTRKLGESKEDYYAALYADLVQVQDKIYENCGFYPVVFTYPFGRVDKSSREVVKNMGFKMSLGCGEVVNIITHDPECLYLLGRFNRAAGISTESFMKRIQY